MSASDLESLDRSEIYPKNISPLSRTTTFAVAGGGEGEGAIAQFVLLSMTNIRCIIKIWGLLLPTRQVSSCTLIVKSWGRTHNFCADSRACFA